MLSLIESLLEFDRENQYILYSCGDGPPASLQADAVRHIPQIPRPSRLNWLLDRWTMARRLDRDRLDVFHASEFTSIPSLGKTAVWAYVYDLIPFVFWEETRRDIPVDYSWALRLALKRAAQADLIVTISEHSKKDICNRLQVDEGRVAVVRPGCGENLAPRPDAADKLLDRYQLEGAFLFYVGGSDFRKNIPRLIRAFDRVCKSGYEGKLVLAGETFLWNIPEVDRVRREIASAGLEERVLLPGFVPDQDLACFFSACDLFVFPSLYEGFGLPLVEAMRCGAPVATGRVSAMPEVVGEAAVFFDPGDEGAMAEAISGALQRPALRDDLRSKGALIASEYTWKRTALDIIDLYQRAGQRQS